MTSLDIRSNSAVMKRAEQLKRWEESDTNREPPTPRPEHGRKIKFSSGCVFLASCLSGDKAEVFKLLEDGADINTANVDGLTALHQACIDDNLDMVEFLVEQGADINRQDNEGWTPLHATASCGFVSIARFLVEKGADVAAVNSDGDLALDLAIDIQHSAMIEYMQMVVNEYKVDCEKARQAEEQMMLADAKKWLRCDASEIDWPHAKTGATALHVAAAKGYTKVISLLLAGHANVDKQDNDGWTPLHAAAHWGQKVAAEMLIDAMADVELHNYAGQTCIDVADRKILKFLEELRASNKHIKHRPSSQIRISDEIENHMDNTENFMRVEARSDHAKDQANAVSGHDGINTVTEPTDVILRRTQSFENDEKKPRSPPRSAVSVNLGTNGKASMSVGESTLSNATLTPITTTSSTTSTLTIAETSSSTIAMTANTSTKATTKILTPTRSNPAPVDENVAITKQKLSAGAIFKNFFKSFVPPTRDEESETQRKAHAKRVRETRRSTQGVTLDELKSAEEFLKKKNSTISNSSNNNNMNTTNTSSINISSKNNNNNNISNANNNYKSNKLNTFKLEDGSTDTTFPPNNGNIIPSAPAVIAAANLSSSVAQRLTKTTGNNSTDNDKENENRSPLATQAVIQRRRKPKRRSTGVVHMDIEDLYPERQDTVNESEEKEIGSERASSLGSTLSSAIGNISAASSVTDDDKNNRDNTENGNTIDYKALWEAAKMENDELKQQLSKKDSEIIQNKVIIERITKATTKNSLSELEKRERRAMERKLSEMEEELKQLEVYRAENLRLKEENGALIRVISKLSK